MVIIINLKSSLPTGSGDTNIPVFKYCVIKLQLAPAYGLYQLLVKVKVVLIIFMTRYK